MTWQNEYQQRQKMGEVFEFLLFPYNENSWKAGFCTFQLSKDRYRSKGNSQTLEQTLEQRICNKIKKLDTKWRIKQQLKGNSVCV